MKQRMEYHGTTYGQRGTSNSAIVNFKEENSNDWYFLKIVYFVVPPEEQMNLPVLCVGHRFNKIDLGTGIFEGIEIPNSLQPIQQLLNLHTNQLFFRVEEENTLHVFPAHQIEGRAVVYNVSPDSGHFVWIAARVDCSFEYN